jgi:hypothetical protein
LSSRVPKALYDQVNSHYASTTNKKTVHSNNSIPTS